MDSNDIDKLKAYAMHFGDGEQNAQQKPSAAGMEWATVEAWRVLQEENARLKAGLTDIANADGDESNVHGSLRWIEGYHEGTKTQAQRARAALGDSAPPQYPPSVLLARIERLEAALDAILSIEQQGGDKHSWAGGHDYVVRAVQDIARKALGGVP